MAAGAVLAPGKRTVTQALRVMGLADQPGFGRYHEVLNRARGNDVARRLLLHVLAVLRPNGEVVIAVGDTIERRWGARIKARGIYRDPVRSSQGRFVKISGARWLSLAMVLPVPFANCRWALPSLSVLVPSARWAETMGKRHKTLTDRARQAILQTKRWLRDRRVVIVAGSSFAALEFRCRAASRLPDHPAAFGCQPVRTRSGAPDRQTWPVGQERETPARTQCRAGRSGHRLDPGHAPGLSSKGALGYQGASGVKKGPCADGQTRPCLHHGN